jgi:hypothetical protein
LATVEKQAECAGENNQEHSEMTMMTRADIRTELGWSDDMIHSLLQEPDSTNARRCKHTGAYTYGLYKRERVLAVAQTTEGWAAKRQWDETLRGNRPNPGWTTRLGDIGRVLGITAVATGKILEGLGYRSDKGVTDNAVAAGCGVRRWDGYAMHDDWHLDRVVSAIRSAAQLPGETAAADSLAAAVVNQERREWVAARKREQEETEAARLQEEEAVVSGLWVELRTLRATDPGMTLLTGVEFITPDPAHRIALYRRCSAEDRSIRSSGMGQDDPGHLKIASSVARDLAFLQRRAMAEGFQV